MAKEVMRSVLFVCLGNICRSPIAEGVFRARLTAMGLQGQVKVDSAGTSGFHAGSPPDVRSQRVCKENGINIGSQRSRKVSRGDFEAFDLVVAMDRTNERDLLQVSQGDGNLSRLLEFSDTELTDVPDPYYGGASGFEKVLDLLEDGCASLLKHIKPKI